MTKKSARILAYVAGGGALIGVAGCCSLWWRPGCAPKIVTQPQSQLIQQGSPVTFSVTTFPTNVLYQWTFNGVDIAGATSSSFTIASVNFTDVGDYRVRVWASPTNTSDPAHLSVYSLSGNGGTLQTPISAYTSQSFTCPPPNGGTFNKGYVLLNSQGTPALFYGPNASPQSDPFRNTSNTRLTIDTFNSGNGTSDTGIRIQNNWVPLATAGCNDNASPSGQPGQTDPKQSKRTITLSSGTSQNSYRLVLFYKDPPGPPTSGTLTFNWLYEP